MGAALVVGALVLGGCAEDVEGLDAETVVSTSSALTINSSLSAQYALGTSTAKGPVGYLSSFQGLGLSQGLAADIPVVVPTVSNPDAMYTALGVTNGAAKVVGVMQSLAWDGTSTSPIQMTFLVSKANQTLLLAASSNLITMSISKIGWWVGGYDSAAAMWYEQFAPTAVLTNTKLALTSGQANLSVSSTASSVSPSSLPLYTVTIKIVPPFTLNDTLYVAASATSSKLTLTW